jgi:hypothetical protein
MALKSEQLPNLALNGDEIRQIAVRHFDEMLKRDCMFLRQQAYRRCSFKLTAVFHLGYPVGDYTVELVPPLGSPLGRDIPLAGSEDENEETALKALERSYDLDNPNVQRIAHGLPITLLERKAPEPVVAAHPIPGEPPEGVLNPFPAMVEHELRYHPDNFPPPPGPIDFDATDREAEKLKIEPVPVRDRSGRFLKRS